MAVTVTECPAADHIHAQTIIITLIMMSIIINKRHKITIMVSIKPSTSPLQYQAVGLSDILRQAAEQFRQDEGVFSICVLTWMNCVAPRCPRPLMASWNLFHA